MDYKKLERELKAIIGYGYNQVPGLGAVLYKDGNPCYKLCAGRAYIGKSGYGLDKDFRMDSLFRVASVSKQFTVYAIMQLVEKSLLGLDADVRFFAAVVNQTLQTFEPIPIGFTGTVAGAEDGRNLPFLQARYNVFGIPLDAGRISLGGEIHISTEDAHFSFVLDKSVLLLHEHAGLTAEQLVGVLVQLFNDAFRPVCVIKAHVGIQQDEVGRTADLYGLFLTGRCAYPIAVDEIMNVESFQVGFVVVTVVGVVVDDDDVDPMTGRFANGAHGAPHFFLLVEKGNDYTEAVVTAR